MTSKNKYYEVRGPGNRYVCLPTESEETARRAFFDAILDGLADVFPFSIYEIENGEERRIK